MLLSGRKGLDAFLAQYGGRIGQLPEIAGMYRDRNLVICGDAIGVWDDLQRFGCKSSGGKGMVSKVGWDFLVVNKLGETFPGAIDHWYSNAPGLLDIFSKARRQEYAQEFAPPAHTHSCQPGAMWHWPFAGQGTSGFGAILVGLGLGYESIVLCGIPLDDGPHNGEPPWRRTKFATSEVKDDDLHWQRARGSLFKGRVFSMSGRTKEWLGEP